MRITRVAMGSGPHGAPAAGRLSLQDPAPAATAACWARELGLDLVLASVVAPPRMPVAPGVGAPPPGLIPSTSERLTRRGDTLDELASLAHGAPRTRVVTGPVGPQLRRLARIEPPAGQQSETSSCCGSLDWLR